MNLYSTELVRYLATQSWQIALLTLAIAAITWGLRHKTAHVRYLLWLIVLAKCLVPPFFAVPLKVLPEKTAAPQAAVTEPSAVESVTIEPERTGHADLAPPSHPRSQQRVDPVMRPAVTSVAPPVGKSVNVRTYAGAIWIVGAGLYLVMNLLRALRGRHWLHAKRRPLPDDIRRQLEDLLPANGRRSLPAIWIMDEIGQPFVWGLLRGTIYVPSRFLEAGDPEHRRHVLAHELSHVLRFDAAVNALQTLAQGLFWFHPFVWWTNRQIRREREKCCDEMAVAQLGTEAKAYCHAVVETLASAETSTRPVPSLAVAGPARNLEERIKTMLRPGKRFYRRPTGPTAFIVLLMAIVTAPTAIVLTVRARADIVQRDAPMALDDVNDVLEIYQAAQHANGPDRYLMVLRNDRDVIVTYRNGPMLCWAVYNFSGPIRAGRLTDQEAAARERDKAGETIASILAWTDNRTPQGAEAYDGTGGYRLSSDGFGHLKSSPSQGIRRERVGTPFVISPTLQRLAWPAIQWPKSTCRIISDDHLALDNGLICIEEEHEVTHSRLGVIPYTTRFYLNPERGYICQRWHEVNSAYAEEVTEYGQTDQGQWYPLEVGEFGRRYSESPMTAELTQINVLLLDTDPTFPEDIFDPNALLARYEADLVFESPEEVSIRDGASDASNTRVAGRVLEGETREPIAGALVRVAAPAMDMRDTRVPTEQTIYEARTGADGTFELSVPTTEGMEAVSVDALAPGYNTAAGTFRTGSSNPMLMHIPLDAMWRMMRSNLTVMLPKGLYVAGMVKDEQGRPAPGITVFASLRTDRYSGGIARTQTDERGQFEIFDYPFPKPSGEWAVLSFTSPTTLPEEITGLYDLTEEQRTSLEVTVRSGRRITGVVQNANDRPAAGVVVEAVLGQRPVIGETMTDQNGRFELAGLPEGPLSVQAYDMANDQKADLPIALGSKDQEVTVRMQPIELADSIEPVTLLGMQVVDVTEEIQEAYGLYGSEGVMIWDPGLESARLGIGELKKGYRFWTVGNERIASIKDMVTRILEAQLTPWQDNQPHFQDPPPAVRVVYRTRRSNHTQYLTLTRADVDELVALANTLGPSDPTTEASVRGDNGEALQTRVAGRVLAEETRQPIGGAIVRVAVPAMDMRLVRSASKQLTQEDGTISQIYEAKTDSEGAFEVLVPVAEGNDMVSVDALAPGFGSAAGPCYTSGLNPQLAWLPLSGRECSNLTVLLPKTMYVAGVVRNPQHVPLAGVRVDGRIFTDTGSFWVGATTTDAQGRFEIFDFPRQKESGKRAELSFNSPKTLPEKRAELHDLSEQQLRALDVVLKPGRKVTGVVRDASGRPTAGAVVEAIQEHVIRDTTTDHSGRFELAGLPEVGTFTLRAFAADIDQKAVALVPFVNRPRDEEVTLKMAPIEIKTPLRPVALLGMQLVDVTGELESAYDLLPYGFSTEGVMILDPGADHRRFQIGELKKTYCFHVIGQKRISNVAQMATELLRQVTYSTMSDREDIPNPIRVVYSVSNGFATQYMQLTPADVDELKRFAAGLGMAVAGSDQ